MEHRRQSFRAHINEHCDIRNISTNENHEGILIDISVMGVGFVSSDYFEAGDNLEIIFSIKNKEIIVKGKITSVHYRRDLFSKYGFLIEAINNESRALIKEYVLSSLKTKNIVTT